MEEQVDNFIVLDLYIVVVVQFENKHIEKVFSILSPQST